MENTEKTLPEVTAEETKTEHSHHHSYHSHHSHHHHHHRSRSKRNSQKKNRFVAFLKHNRKKLMYVGAALALLLVLVLTAVLMDGRLLENDNDFGQPSQSQGVEQQTQSSIQLEISFFTKDVSVVVPAVSAYMQTDVSVPANEIFQLYRGEENTIRLDISVPVKLSYQVSNIPDGYSVKKAELYVSDSSTFSNAKVYTLKNTETSASVPNLRTATQYYYRFDITLSNGSVTSAQGSFRTADTPRILTVEGIANVRDVGWWKTEDGKRIRQGLLYRGTELDAATSGVYSVTKTGVYTLLTDMGVRTDLDLRSQADNKTGADALGVSVSHRYYSLSNYDDIFATENTESIRVLFADLADPNIYPAYMHCSYGMDRTGTAVFLLQALLGMSEEDLIREYHLSSLHHGDLWARNQFNDFVKRFKLLDGDTMQKKAETYLLAVGVTPDQMASIRSLFLETE